MQRGIAAENCGYAFLLGQVPVFIVEFFVDPKNGTLKKTTFVLLQVASFSCIY